MTDQFRDLVRDFSAAYEQQTATAMVLKEVRARTKGMQRQILEYMRAHDIDECEWQGGRLVRKQAKKTEGLKKEHIQGELLRLVGGDDSAVNEAVAGMYNRRLTDVHEKLSVVKE